MKFNKARLPLILGVGLVGGIGYITLEDTITRETAFGQAVDKQTSALAYGNPIDISKFRTDRYASITAAIEKTLDGMGNSVSDTGRAAGAACLIGAMNGADIHTGIELYRQALTESKPDLLPTALRSCENALVATGAETFIVPFALEGSTSEIRNNMTAAPPMS
ncbi:MAG: hypothetical protein ABWX94_03715 [Candidatus Saccharimonadales bacterium]